MRDGITTDRGHFEDATQRGASPPASLKFTAQMSRNQRLYDAIRQVGKDFDDIAREVDADAKTVSRWITTGRLPRPAVRHKLAHLLGVPEAVLWPQAPGAAQGTSELVAIYATRRELPPATVSALLDAAEHHIDVLAYAALWLWDTVPAFVDRVQIKIARGANVRICLGDPDSEAVRVRGREEAVDDALIGRCRLALTYARGIHDVDPRAVRLTGTTLYTSVFRFDDDVLLNTHFWGNAAGDSPTFHFRRQRSDGIAERALSSFERVWTNAQPLPNG